MTKTAVNGHLLCHLFFFSLIFGISLPSGAHAEDSWSTPHHGVRLLKRSTWNPWRIRVLKIDLCAQGIAARATAESERGRTTSSFAHLVGAEIAINGDFYGSGSNPIGMAIGDGDHWSADGSSQGFIAFGHNRAMITDSTRVYSSPESWMENAIAGFPLVEDGARFHTLRPDHCTARHPRTAVGLDRQGRYLYLAIVDGRSSSSIGMYCRELADLMIEMGAWSALNLDGGGSTTMYVEGAGGIVHSPSDGSQRSVANHLAIYATGSGPPDSCQEPIIESVVNASILDTGHTDINGDGMADICGLASAGFLCKLANGNGFDDILDELILEDLHRDSGGTNAWRDLENYSTIRMGDINGDGMADVCARENRGIACWPSQGTSWGGRIEGPELSDELGWNQYRYRASLRLADVTGDGLDDLCARSSAGLRCYPSLGDGFDDSIQTEHYSNDSGWAYPEHYNTMRFGDIDGDGRQDVCLRSNGDMSCRLSAADEDPPGFPTGVSAPDWSDGDGWTHVNKWSTIRLIDLDADGRADLCGRHAEGIRCHLSEGDSFGPEIIGPELSDEVGWGGRDNYTTLRFADIDGDLDQDLCIRANAGIRCFRFEIDEFTDSINGPELSDDRGWNQERYYPTIRMADINGDGMADICGRHANGVECWLSDGNGFPTHITGQGFTDEWGWASLRHNSTIRLSGPPIVIEEDPDADVDGPEDASPGDSDIVDEEDAGPSYDADADSGNGDETGPLPDAGIPLMSGSCDCSIPRVAGKSSSSLLSTILGMLLRL